VAELSSYQLENLKVSPHLTIFLNFFPDHLDRHHNLENYFEAKENLWKYQKSGDFLIVPEKTKDTLNKKSIQSELVIAETLNSDFFARNLIFQAEYWRENFGTIRSLAKALRIENVDKLLKKTAENFAGLPHRMEFFAEKNSIKFYDDSISTNPDSTLAGVNFFEKDLGCILLGGQDRKQDFTKLLTRLKELETLIIVLPTESRENLLKTIEKVGLTNFVDVKKWNGFEKIIEIVFTRTQTGKVCLLSCAAPSYDLFKNFIDRGNQFKKSVK
jgi:UDP-N-acetylmuramoylalanine--D-glutamate ligase